MTPFFTLSNSPAAITSKNHDADGIFEGLDYIPEISSIYEEDSVSEDIVFEKVDEKAEFPGGMVAFSKFLSQNVRYPESALQNDIQGRVIIRIVVEKDGNISDKTVHLGVDPNLDKEALRVAGKLPAFKPAIKDGRPVRSYFTFPVSFNLQSK